MPRRRGGFDVGELKAGDPELAVLLPCRDEAEHLPECIRSLEQQTFSRFRVVAVDDGSRDGSRRLLREWSDRDPRVRVLRTSGIGLPRALNRAASATRAPLLARMDADDMALPRRLERQVGFMERHPGLAACGTGVEYFPAGEVGPGYRRYFRWINSLRSPREVNRDLLVECPVAHPTLVIRRSVFRALGGYRDAEWPEDYDLLLRLHLAGMGAANVDGRLLRWRLSPDSLSRRSPSYSESAFRRCKVHFLLAGFLPPDRPAVVWGAGSVGKAFGREMAGQGRQPKAFVDLDPRKIGQRIHGVPVLSPDGFRRRWPASGRDGDAPGSPPYVLAAVGAPGGRAEIREELERLGWEEIRDFRAVA